MSRCSVLSGASPNTRLGEIRNGTHLDYFYIYGETNRLEDHLVDLSLEQPVPASILAGTAREEDR